MNSYNNEERGGCDKMLANCIATLLNHFIIVFIDTWFNALKSAEKGQVFEKETYFY